MISESKVYFFFEVNGFSLRNRKKLKTFIEHIFKKEKAKLNSLNYVFCSDKRLLAINKQYLQHNYFTDIITFDLSDSDKITGEIYISIDRVRENAKLHKKTFSSELHRVIFHGVLHLCGYKDKTPEEAAIMRKKEDDSLNKYNSFHVKPE